MQRVLTYILVAAVFALPFLVSAEDHAERKLPGSGMLSRTQQGGNNVSIDGVWGRDPSSSDPKNAPPITGSVSREEQGKKWRLSVANSTKDTYRAELELIQLDASSKKLKSDYFSFTLKGGASSARDVDAQSRSRNAEVRLVSWKKVGGEKHTPPAQLAKRK